MFGKCPFYLILLNINQTYHLDLFQPKSLDLHVHIYIWPINGWRTINYSNSFNRY